MSTEIATVALHVERSGAGATPLLLLHGMTGSSDDWRHVFDLAALRARYDVIAPDLRGHGRSRDIGERFSHRACAADVLAMLDAQGLQRQPVAAIGLSLGGNTLLHAAAQQPERFSALVLVSTTLEYDERARAIMSQMRFDALPEVERELSLALLVALRYLPIGLDEG